MEKDNKNVKSIMLSLDYESQVGRVEKIGENPLSNEDILSKFIPMLMISTIGNIIDANPERDVAECVDTSIETITKAFSGMLESIKREKRILH